MVEETARYLWNRRDDGALISAKLFIRRLEMDREHVKGAADKAKGAIKDTAGKLMDDKKLQAEGKIDKAKGAAHDAAGDVKDAARHAKEAIDND
jgi:uncharacterized protein YjbJ (UPF0337 family)